MSKLCAWLVRPCTLLLSYVALASASLSAQESKALLHAPMAVLPIESAPFQRLGDFDGDGDLDAVGSRVTTNGSISRVEVWQNDGGAFSSSLLLNWSLGTGFSQGPRSLPIEVADLNGDGLCDIVIATATTVERLIAGPGMQFTQQTWWLVGAQPGRRAIAIGDFDADGTVDVAVAAPSNVANARRLFVFFGSGQWTYADVPVLGNGFPRLDVLEVDGLPGDELLLSDRLQSTATLFKVAGGQLQSTQSFTSTLTQGTPTMWLWMAGDIDGDHDDDIVVFRPSGVPALDSRFQIFRQTSPNTFAAESIAIGGPAEYLADIDGDGDLDGVCCGGGGSSFVWPTLDFPSTFEITTNRGGGDFALAYAFPGAGSESLAGAADVDGDGDVDLVAGRCVFYGDGPWDRHPMPLAGGSGSSLVRRPFDLGDVDRDGDIDFRTVINRGDGVFAAAAAETSPIAGTTYLLEGIACDVDGDGVRDRVHRLHQSAAANGFIRMVWLRNNGGGHLTYEGGVAPAGVMFGAPSGDGIDDFFVADFDGDGDEDIYAQDTKLLYWNDAGMFNAAPVTLPVVGRIEGCADFNDDGVLDVLLSGGFEHYILEGTGLQATPFAQVWAGSAPWLTSSWPYEPAATPIGDVNGDGRLDFTRVFNNWRIYLFINQSAPGASPTFQRIEVQGVAVDLHQQLAYAARPTLSFGDIDGDGNTDIVVGGIADEANVGGVLRRLTNDPNNHSYELIRFAMRGGFVADMDLDGDLDVVGDYAIRNRRFGRGAGTRIQSHAGVAGEMGAVPVLGGTGPYQVGAWHTLHLSGVPGPTVAVLGLSLGEAALANNPLPGLTLRLDLGTLLVGSMPILGDGLGRAAAMSTVPLPILPGMQGWTFYLQAFVPDAAASPGFSQSNLLTIRVGS